MTGGDEEDRPAVRVATRPTPLSKRVLDVVLSALGLLLSAPAWALLSLAVKLEDGGPVFFSHARIGKGGVPFRVRKFRSMVPDHGRGPSKEQPDDALVTRVGRLMRATALDELPQLWSIFRGEMSFVGPRALPATETAAEEGEEPLDLTSLPGFRERLTVLPGLTGLAQVRAPRDVSYRHKFRYDVFYARHRSFWLDVELIVRSVWISVRGKWPEVGEGA